MQTIDGIEYFCDPPFLKELKIIIYMKNILSAVTTIQDRTIMTVSQTSCNSKQLPLSNHTLLLCAKK